jgi:hypothetical protein
MIERWKNPDGSETIVVMDDPPRPSLLRRIFGFIGKTLLFLLLSALPLWLLTKGITGLATGKLSWWSRTRGAVTYYGYEAVGWSWIWIGFAFGAVGFIFKESLAGWIKRSFWLIAAACIGTGAYHLLKGG